MPFISELYVYSYKPLDHFVSSDCSAVGGQYVVISSAKELLLHDLLLSVNQDSINEPMVAIANRRLHIDCTEKFARTLGITFVKMNKYKNRDGIKRAYYAVDLAKFSRHPRFAFSVGQLFRTCKLRCLVCPSELLQVEHSLNINAPMMPQSSPMDVVAWAGLAVLSCPQNVVHLQNGIDFDQRRPLNVYRIRNGGLLAKECIGKVMEDENIVCVVGISSPQAFLQCTDYTAPCHDESLPPPTFVFWRPEGAREFNVLNYS